MKLSLFPGHRSTRNAAYPSPCPQQQPGVKGGLLSVRTPAYHTFYGALEGDAAVKVAVISDIHANAAALEAVLDHVERWAPDHVIVAGDVINRGPEPVVCLTTIREKEEKGWNVVIGNHEEYVLFHESPEAPRSGPQF